MVEGGILVIFSGRMDSSKAVVVRIQRWEGVVEDGHECDCLLQPRGKYSAVLDMISLVVTLGGVEEADMILLS